MQSAARTRFAQTGLPAAGAGRGGRAPGSNERQPTPAPLQCSATAHTSPAPTPALPHFIHHHPSPSPLTLPPPQYVNPDLSQKILDQVREQQQEIEAEEAGFGGGAASAGAAAAAAAKGKGKGRSVRLVDELHDLDSDGELQSGGEEGGDYAEEEAYEYLEVDPGDEAALRLFMSDAPPQRQTLADIIMAKIKEKETEIASQMSGISEGWGWGWGRGWELLYFV